MTAATLARRIGGRLRLVRRLTGFVLLLALLGIVVPDAGHPQARFALVKVDGVHGLDATDDVVWLLALGSDARPGEPPLGSRSDAIQLVGVNAETGHGVTIGIPRDSYVDIPGYGSDKINAAMVYGGPQATADAVGALTGIQPDYVFVTTFEGLRMMVKGVGGIRAKVTYPMDDLGHTFKPGMHEFTGSEALQFSRIRYGLPNGDFDRSMNQGQFLRGGLETMQVRAEKPGGFEESLAVMARFTDTDLDPTELYRLGRTVLEADPGKVKVCVIPGSIGMAGAASVVHPDVGFAQALGRDVSNDATLDKGC